jgi:hypothetical protein
MSRTTWIVLVVVVAIFTIGLVVLFVPRVLSQPAVQPALPGGQQSTPQQEEFHGCPREGRGGDTFLNLLKNRIDEGSWGPATIEQMLALKWPKGVENRKMSGWSAADRAEVARNNGIAVQVEGYLLLTRQEGAEATNCGSSAMDEIDYHMWLAAKPEDPRPTKSVVIEVTPRVRAKHPSWNYSAFSGLVRDKTRIRVSGWTMLDPEHPEEVGKSRGTIWEVHPVMKVEMQVSPGGGWQEL